WGHDADGNNATGNSNPYSGETWVECQNRHCGDQSGGIFPLLHFQAANHSIPPLLSAYPPSVVHGLSAALPTDEFPPAAHSRLRRYFSTGWKIPVCHTCPAEENTFHRKTAL